MDSFISKEEFFEIMAEELPVFKQLILTQIEEVERDDTQVFIGVTPAIVRDEDGNEYNGFLLLFEEAEKPIIQ